MESTSTVEIVRIKGADVACCDPTCDQPASYAIIAPMKRYSLRLYEMQTFCRDHYIGLEKREHTAWAR